VTVDVSRLAGHLPSGQFHLPDFAFTRVENNYACAWLA
jgi:hypothetical protein